MAELWYDSALITAFDSAVAKYKEMHSQSGKPRTMAGKRDVISESDYNVISESESLEAEADLAKTREDKRLQHMIEEPEKDKAACDIFQNENVIEKGYTCEHEWPEKAYKKYPAVEHEQERQQIMSELQHLTELQNRLLDRLAKIKNMGLGGTVRTTSQPFTYSTHGSSAPVESCYPYHYNVSSSCALQCQDCGYVSNGSYNCQENSSQYCETPHVTSQKLLDASALPQIVRTAVAEAMKEAAEAQNCTGEIKHSGLSDVVVAWFLAGFHTSSLC